MTGGSCLPWEARNTLKECTRTESFKHPLAVQCCPTLCRRSAAVHGAPEATNDTEGL